MKHLRNERGVALLVTILGLVVAGSVVTAFVAVSVMDHRTASNTRRQGQAFAAAEYGLGQTIGNWNSASLNLTAVDASVAVSGSTPQGSATYAGTVRRLNNELFLVNIVGEDGSSGAQARVGSFVRLRAIDMDIRAALTTQGPTRIGGSTEIHGDNEDPLGWSGCDPDSDLAGIRLPSAGDLDTQGQCSDGSCIDGSPQVDTDSTVADSTFFQYGDVDWDALVAMATKQLTPSTHTGVGPTFDGNNNCQTSDQDNWGDPLNPASTCGGYFPILYSPGDLSISGGSGQGVLLVDGHLSVQGGFDFYGVVIVRKSLKTTGTGGHFNGSVMAANVDLDQNTVLGDALVQYSACAKNRVLTNALPGTLLRSRGWLYSY